MQFPGFDHLLEHRPDIAFRTLVTVVDGGVQNIDTRSQAGLDRSHVGLIGGIAGVAEICPQSDGGKPKLIYAGHVRCLAEVAGVAQIRKAVAIAGSAGGGGMSRKHGEIV